ncbi:CRISPR-associated helicase Cas3' [Bacillus canaveralius]|uniref:CRISPR-associated helicase Cas3' n=1 Tax=Bacillus canaveralius TaxID=1403243 RepID=UPI000F7AC787|nr:CRISPR-associated helicase Cas3' [Bacillus canaveralius]RSK53992.1 CRISPR-associated helicase Cas3' [Bacillus canaveralius]
MEFYAKSFQKETITKHTNNLLTRLDTFKNIYQSLLSLRDWELLEIAVRYHDVGKVDSVFQNKIRKIIGEPPLPQVSSYDIPHNLLSVMAIPFKALKLDKDESKLVAQIVAYHHERGLLPDKQQIFTNYKDNICPFKKEVEEQLGILIDEESKASKMNKVERRILPSDGALYYRYILLKGFLHRLDHAASAHVPVELATEMAVGSYVNKFFQDHLKVNKKPLQIFTEQHQNHHLVVVAQTGMGKTEAGLLWLGNKKGFFTLPLRVSINAMYSRITKEDNINFTKKGKEGEEAVGLLHSTSLDYLYDQEEGDDEALEKVHSQSKEFANKLVISTIDQVLKFPFHYLGFEKEYATMATSKVIIDELQAYDPKIAAVLIRAMTMIDKIGGSFMIMTATLPGFYYKALEEELVSSKLPLTYAEFIDDSVKRHNVLLHNQSIIDEAIIEEIHSYSSAKKILVICNTVDRACEVYEKLKEIDAPVWFLHSRFIKKDRSHLEKQIIDFANDGNFGIWVTTQLVEASLDIDFDLLYTEMSTLDSQFQRYGRCNRKGAKSIDTTNVHVMTEDVTGVSKSQKSVYHYDIYDSSLHLLRNHSAGLLLESEKHEMIKDLYDEQNLENSNFLNEFRTTLEEMKNRPHYDPNLKKGKAQDLLRDIQQVQAIPIAFQEQEEFLEKLAEWRNAGSKEEKRRSRNAIEAYSVGVNKYRAENVGLSEVEGIKGLHYIHCDYDVEKGLNPRSESIFI